MKTPELYCDVNITPIRGPNPEWSAGDTVHAQWIQNSPCYDYMKTLGFRDMPMIYDGTLNRILTYTKEDGTFADANNIDWNKEGNYSAPPQEKAVRAFARLTQNVKQSAPQSENFLPFLFDLENAAMGISIDASDADREALIQTKYLPAVQWAKLEAPYSRVGWYSLPPMPNGDGLNTIKRFQDYQKYNTTYLQEMANWIDFAAPGFYNWDLPAANPGQWFDQVEMMTTILDKNFSHLPRVAVITPTYQIYNPGYWKQVADLNGKPIPPDLWKKQCRFLVERDYDLYLWTGNTLLKDAALNILLATDFVD